MSTDPETDYCSINEKDTEILNKNNFARYSGEDEDFYRKFMIERDLPNWYRGLSHFQMDGADSLLNCLRDDSQQGTSHRVKEALVKIGIEPLVNSRKIKLAMRLSRGNDIAFLWFLMELYYRNNCDNCKHGIPLGYTVNEQVILSTIAHLDLITTLRELDRLLPKQPSKPRPTKINKSNVKRKKPSYILPYFEKQHRPSSYGKSLILYGGDTTAYLGAYDRYLNPNYIVANESNRWYADHKLDKADIIAKRIVNDEINEIFERQNVGGLVDDEEKPKLCAHHQTFKIMKESMINELEVTKRKACEKYFDVDGRLKDKSYKRCINQLNKEIENAKQYFKKFTIDNLRMEKTSFSFQMNTQNKYDPSTPNLLHRYLHRYDYGHGTTPISREHFFEAPTCHTPYKFNYCNIFDLGPKNPIKDAMASALNGGSSCNMSIDQNRAVKKCCEDIWTNEVQKYKDECLEKEKAKRKEGPPPEEPALKFDLPYYNPRNQELMKSMLYQALQEMKKNKKFVLASLPESYKTPILKEWIRKRYGMVYTRKERRLALQYSKKVFHVLKKDRRAITVPNLKELSTKGIVTYACKKYLLRKTNYLKQTYYHNFRQDLLADTRDYWGACKPYHCSRGPPRKSFFVYLPAKENDIHMFRPWKKNEFIHAKDEWDKRQRIKRMKLLY